MTNTNTQAYDTEPKQESEGTPFNNPGAQPTMIVNDKVINPKPKDRDTENER